jgi:hypothetical protein
MKKSKISKYVRFANGYLKLTIDEVKAMEIHTDKYGFRYINYAGGKFEINDIRL